MASIINTPNEGSTPSSALMRNLEYLATISLLIIIYYAVAKLGLLAAVEAEQVTVVWPPTGLSLAAMLILGRNVWPAIWVGAFLTNVTSHETVLTAAGIATGNALEALIGSFLLRRVTGFRNDIGRIRDVLALTIAAASFSTFVAAAIGTICLCMSALQPWTSFSSIFALWWLGDATGDLLFAPPLLLWLTYDTLTRPRQRGTEYLIMIASITFASIVVFNNLIEVAIISDYTFIYFVFPFIIWAAIRFGQSGTSVVTLMISIIAIWATIHGNGPFVVVSPSKDLASLQIFLGVLSVTGLVLSAVHNELREAEKTKMRLAAIVASSNDAIIGKDLDGFINFWNLGAERLFGYSATEALGKPITIIVPPERYEEELHAHHRLERGEFLENRETVRISKDGRRLDISLMNSPIYDDSGRIIGISKVARDITERKQIEQSLKDADMRKNEFLAVLAHELRNPLAPLSNALHVLKVPNITSDRYSKSLDIMERQLQHIVRLVDDLVDVSRISHGKVELQKKLVLLSHVVSTAVETNQPMLDTKNHSLSILLPEEEVWFEGDPVRLSQIFSNLLHNAIKYTSPGGHIWIDAKANEKDVAVKVRDTGIGIPANLMPVIFDMFIQLDQATDRVYEGLGIGLKLAKTFVELHGGKIEANSRGTGCGTEFVVTLPRAIAEGPVVPATKPVIPSDGEDKLRVLVVDDHKTLAETLGWMVETLGHEVMLAFNGSDALAIAQSYKPNVVLLDIGLAGMNGYEVCQRMRASPTLKNCVIVAQTGWGQAEHRQRSKNAGFDLHLVKPVHIDVLENLFTDLPSCAST